MLSATLADMEILDQRIPETIISLLEKLKDVFQPVLETLLLMRPRDLSTERQISNTNMEKLDNMPFLWREKIILITDSSEEMM